MSESTASPLSEEAALRAEVDASARWPVLFFLTSGMLWLVVAILLGAWASVKLVFPGFLDVTSLLNYGRLQPMHLAAFIYGWGFNVAFGVIFWMTARLSKVAIRNPISLLVAAGVWNMTVSFGLLGILFGYGSGMELMEFPIGIWPVLIVTQVYLGGQLVAIFRSRRDEKPFVSMWYILGSVFWFPWIAITALLLTEVFPSAAVMNSAVNAWYQSNLLLLWFGSIGLAVAYYLIPKITNKPIHSYSLSFIGFWGIAVLAGWSGMYALNGGPLPVWLPGVSAAAAFIMLIPISVIAVNHHMTAQGRMALVKYSPTLRFTVFGTISFTVLGGVAALMSLFTMSQYAQFTIAKIGYQFLVLYGFFTMVMFGAIYFIVPRLTGREWVSGKMIGFHFLFNAYGTVFMLIVTVIGGIQQGSGAYDRPWKLSHDFVQSYLAMRCVLWLFLLSANAVYFYHLVKLAFVKSEADQGPTLFQKMPSKLKSVVEGQEEPAVEGGTIQA
ncbi:MAG: cbb3-type cytochrome c oxidase subunit I [Verrucomicrobiota bacterium]